LLPLSVYDSSLVIARTKHAHALIKKRGGHLTITRRRPGQLMAR
jgi:hypothetical protein